MNNDIANNNEMNGEANCNDLGGVNNSPILGNELGDNIHGNSKSEGEEKVKHKEDNKVYFDVHEIDEKSDNEDGG